VADASYGIDRASLSVWVNVITVGERESTGRLCRRHANALTVPHGWTLDDRRDPTPKLFRVAEFDSAGKDGSGGNAGKKQAGGRAAPKKRARAKPEDVPSLFEALRRELDEPGAQPGDGGGGDPGGQPEDGGGEPGGQPVDPDETQAIPWSPRLGRTVEYEDGEEKPRYGRLLGRAFGEQPEEDAE
jgi:hypothetical protein